MKTFRKERVTNPSPRGDIITKIPAGEHNDPHGDGNITLHRTNGGHSTAIGENLSMNEPRNKGLTPLTTNAGSNKQSETLKSDKRAREENSLKAEVKFSLLIYSEQLKYGRYRTVRILRVHFDWRRKQYYAPCNLPLLYSSLTKSYFKGFTAH